MFDHAVKPEHRILRGVFTNRLPAPPGQHKSFHASGSHGIGSSLNRWSNNRAPTPDGIHLGERGPAPYVQLILDALAAG